MYSFSCEKRPSPGIVNVVCWSFTDFSSLTFLGKLSAPGMFLSQPHWYKNLSQNFWCFTQVSVLSQMDKVVHCCFWGDWKENTVTFYHKVEIFLFSFFVFLQTKQGLALCLIFWDPPLAWQPFASWSLDKILVISMKGRAARGAAEAQQPRPCDRYKHACAVCRGFVYLHGGHGSTTLRDFWRYHTGELAPSLVCQD